MEFACGDQLWTNSQENHRCLSPYMTDIRNAHDGTLSGGRVLPRNPAGQPPGCRETLEEDGLLQKAGNLSDLHKPLVSSLENWATHLKCLQVPRKEVEINPSGSPQRIYGEAFKRRRRLLAGTAGTGAAEVVAYTRHGPHKPSELEYADKAGIFWRGSTKLPPAPRLRSRPPPWADSSATAMF